jgi:hypothetical protein
VMEGNRSSRQCNQKEGNGVPDASGGGRTGGSLGGGGAEWLWAVWGGAVVCVLEVEGGSVEDGGGGRRGGGRSGGQRAGGHRGRLVCVDEIF